MSNGQNTRPSRTLVYVDATLGDLKGFAEDLAVMTLRQKGKQAAIGIDSMSELLSGKGAINDAVAPKLVVSIRADGRNGKVSVNATIDIELYYYLLDGDWYVPKLAFNESAFVNAQSKDEIVRVIQRTIGARPFLLAIDNSLRVAKVTVSTRQARSELRGYNTSWRDPENKRGHYRLSAILGIPTGPQIVASYWGKPGLPIFLGLGGGYLGSTMRSYMADGAWIFDNGGSFRQAIGLWIAGVSDTYTESTQVFDTFGRAIKTQTDTIDWVRFYKGVGYTAELNSLFFQIGAGVSNGRNADPEWKIFLRSGYVFSL